VWHRSGGANMHAAYSLFGQSNVSSCTMREVEAAASDERTTIIDSHYHRAAVVGVRHSHTRTERQRLRRGRQFIGIESLTGTRWASFKFRAIPGCHFNPAPRRNR
jgi:hypothetical protein